MLIYRVHSISAVVVVVVVVVVVTSEGGEGSNSGGLQENIGQPSVRSPLVWIPALSRELESMALEAPFRVHESRIL